MNLLDLNTDCLMQVISHLKLDDQARLARCCRKLRALCLSESAFKRDIECGLSSDFENYNRICINLGSWRLTARFLRDIAKPPLTMIWRVLPKWIGRIVEALPWESIGVDEEVIMREATPMLTCYAMLYPELMDSSENKFWQVMYPKGWRVGPKSALWIFNMELYNYPQSCQNLGFYVRMLIQERIDKYHGG